MRLREKPAPNGAGFFGDSRKIQGLTREEHTPGQEAQNCDDARKDQDGHQVAHDILGLQTCNTKSGQGPEGLDHVGPLVAPGDSHGCATGLHAHVQRAGHDDGALDSPLTATRGDEEVDDTGGQEGEHGEGHGVGNVDKEVGDDTSQTHAAGILNGHQTHDAGVERELEQDARSAAGGVADGVHILAQVAVGQDAQEQEDAVHDVQIEVEALLDEVVHNIDEAHDAHDGPQDLAVLDLLSGGLDLVLAFFLVHQQVGINGDGVLPVGVHGVVDEGHGDQDDQAHNQVHGVENGLGGGGVELLDHGTGGVLNHVAVLAAQGQGNGAGQAGVPDHEARVGGGNEQGIVYVAHALGDLLGQQSTHDEAEAPVQPAADGGHHSGNHDGAHPVLGQTSNGAQDLLADLGGGQGGAQHQHQGHLHGECQQVPHTELGIALASPSPDHINWTHSGADHSGDEHHNGQDDGEQERIR